MADGINLCTVQGRPAVSITDTQRIEEETLHTSKKNRMGKSGRRVQTRDTTGTEAAACAQGKENRQENRRLFEGIEKKR